MRLFKKHHYGVFYVSVLAGLLYNSWPLGYWLNSAVSNSSLASGLEAVGQPYNWVFIFGDIISSILVIALCYILWRKYSGDERANPINWTVLCFVIFGICTIFDAVIPERCVPELQQCPSFTQDHVLLVHGIFSILASVALFVGFCIVWFYERRTLLLNVFLVGYILFGLITVVEAIAPGNEGNWSQHYFITLCSAWIICIPYVVGLLAKTGSANKHDKQKSQK